MYDSEVEDAIISGQEVSDLTVPSTSVIKAPSTLDVPRNIGSGDEASGSELLGDGIDLDAMMVEEDKYIMYGKGGNSKHLSNDLVQRVMRRSKKDRQEDHLSFWDQFEFCRRDNVRSRRTTICLAISLLIVGLACLVCGIVLFALEMEMVAQWITLILAGVLFLIPGVYVTVVLVLSFWGKTGYSVNMLPNVEIE